MSVAFTTGGQSESHTFDKNEQDAASGRRAVHAAAKQGDKALLELLVSAGAALNVQDRKHDTPLLLACTVGNLELAQVLLDNGADASAANAQGDTPLLAACQALDFELAQVLLDNGADASAANAQGDTPLLRGAAFCVFVFFQGRGRSPGARGHPPARRAETGPKIPRRGTSPGAAGRGARGGGRRSARARVKRARALASARALRQWALPRVMRFRAVRHFVPRLPRHAVWRTRDCAALLTACVLWATRSGFYSAPKVRLPPEPSSGGCGQRAARRRGAPRRQVTGRGLAARHGEALQSELGA